MVPQRGGVWLVLNCLIMLRLFLDLDGCYWVVNTRQQQIRNSIDDLQVYRLDRCPTE